MEWILNVMKQETIGTKQLMLISVLTEDKPGILHKIIDLVTQFQCSIEKCRLVTLGSEANISLLLSASWSVLAKLETQLPSIENQNGFTIIKKRTEPRHYPESNLLPYSVELISIERENLIKDISEFFSDQNIHIYEFSNNPYQSHTGAKMISLRMRVYIPAAYQISDIRENFLLLCEELNIDAIIEPERL